MQIVHLSVDGIPIFVAQGYHLFVYSWEILTQRALNGKTFRDTQKGVSVQGKDVSVLYRNVTDVSVQFHCTETTGIHLHQVMN